MVTKRRKGTLAPTKPADDRRSRFVSEYLTDFNATQAAIRAGYSPKTAYAQGSALLKVPEIKAEVERRQQEVEARLNARYEINNDRIKRELALLGFSNIMDFGHVNQDGEFVFDLSATTREQAAALHSMRVKRSRRTIGRGDDATVVEDVETHFRLADKRAALVDLGKATGLFNDGPDVSVPVTFIIERTERSKPRQSGA